MKERDQKTVLRSSLAIQSLDSWRCNTKNTLCIVFLLLREKEMFLENLLPLLSHVYSSLTSSLSFFDLQGAFHLVKNSENSGSGLNEKRFFGSPDWKIPRKSGTARKVVPFSRSERPHWFLVFQLHLPGNLYQFQAHGNPIF